MKYKQINKEKKMIVLLCLINGLGGLDDPVRAELLLYLTRWGEKGRPSIGFRFTTVKGLPRIKDFKNTIQSLEKSKLLFSYSFSGEKKYFISDAGKQWLDSPPSYFNVISDFLTSTISDFGDTNLYQLDRKCRKIRLLKDLDDMRVPHKSGEALAEALPFSSRAFLETDFVDDPKFIEEIWQDIIRPDRIIIEREEPGVLIEMAIFVNKKTIAEEKKKFKQFYKFFSNIKQSYVSITGMACTEYCLIALLMKKDGVSSISSVGEARYILHTITNCDNAITSYIDNNPPTNDGDLSLDDSFNDVERAFDIVQSACQENDILPRLDEDPLPIDKFLEGALLIENLL